MHSAFYDSERTEDQIHFLRLTKIQVEGAISEMQTQSRPPAAQPAAGLIGILTRVTIYD